MADGGSFCNVGWWGHYRMSDGGVVVKFLCMSQNPGSRELQLECTGGVWQSECKTTSCTDHSAVLVHESALVTVRLPDSRTSNYPQVSSYTN